MVWTVSCCMPCAESRNISGVSEPARHPGVQQSQRLHVHVHQSSECVMTPYTHQRSTFIKPSWSRFGSA